MGEITYKKVHMTPAMAQDILESKNTCNRSIAPMRVAKIASDIENGRWECNPAEPIAFDTNGVLKNGQHRLKAIVKTGIAVDLYVCEGIDSDIYTFDQTKARTIQQYLNVNCGLTGVLGSKAAAILAKLWVEAMRSDKNVINNVVVTHSDVFETLIAEQDTIIPIIELCNSSHMKSAGREVVRGQMFMGACAFAFKAGVPIEVIDRFVSVARTGFAASPSEFAAVAARNRILNCSNYASLKDKWQTCIDIQNAIKSFYEGKPIQSLRHYKNAIYSEACKGIV